MNKENIDIGMRVRFKATAPPEESFHTYMAVGTVTDVWSNGTGCTVTTDSKFGRGSIDHDVQTEFLELLA